jgi:hypothetical protein
MSFSAPAPSPVIMPITQPIMQSPMAPQGEKPQAKNMTPTFLGNLTPMAGQTKTATLLGGSAAA